MNLILLAVALTIVAAVLGAIWAGLRTPADEPTERDRLHHTVTCRCPREPEGAPA